jgi:hypothetical protein
MRAKTSNDYVSFVAPHASAFEVYRASKLPAVAMPDPGAVANSQRLVLVQQAEPAANTVRT